MERKLLLLGLLRHQEMYGYQLNELIERHFGASVHLTKPTAYRFLGAMLREQWVTCREERDGNRPPRQVFAITPAGEQAFLRLLRESLAGFAPAELRGDIGLAFLDALPPAEARDLLLQRRSTIQNLLNLIFSHGSQHHGHFQLVVEHQKRHLDTELAWLDEILGQFR